MAVCRRRMEMLEERHCGGSPARENLLLLAACRDNAAPAPANAVLKRDNRHESLRPPQFERCERNPPHVVRTREFAL